MFGDFADDGRELACQQVATIAFGYIPKLNENFRPAFRVRATSSAENSPAFTSVT